MTKNITTLLMSMLFLGMSYDSNAQLLNTLGKKIERKADQVINKKVNELEKKVEGKSSNKSSNNTPSKKHRGPFAKQDIMINDFSSGTIVFEDNFLRKLSVICLPNGQVMELEKWQQ